MQASFVYKLYSNQSIAYLNGTPVEVAPLGHLLSRFQNAKQTGTANE